MSGKKSPRRKKVLALVAKDLAHEMTEDPTVAARLEAARQASSPITRQLKAAGFDVELIEDLVNEPKHLSRLPEAVPILLRWLVASTDVGVKDQIVYVLSSRSARPLAADIGQALLDEFERLPPASLGLKWSIADAIEGLSATRERGVLNRVLRLVEDKVHGRARQMLVVALGQSRETDVVPLLIRLLGDEEVAASALIALRKLKAKQARPFVERFLTHEASWMRAEAKRFLKATA